MLDSDSGFDLNLSDLNLDSDSPPKDLRLDSDTTAGVNLKTQIGHSAEGVGVDLQGVFTVDFH